MNYNDVYIVINGILWILFALLPMGGFLIAGDKDETDRGIILVISVIIYIVFIFSLGNSLHK